MIENHTRKSRTSYNLKFSRSFYLFTIVCSSIFCCRKWTFRKGTNNIGIDWRRHKQVMSYIMLSTCSTKRESKILNDVKYDTFLLFLLFRIFISVNSDGLTPLDVAVLSNNRSMTKMLLQNGAREGNKCKQENEHISFSLLCATIDSNSLSYFFLFHFYLSRNSWIIGSTFEQFGAWSRKSCSRIEWIRS